MPLRAAYALALAATLLAAPAATGGGGPENLLLVVNANSVASKTVANHYARLRNVPASNVVYIDWRANTEVCNGLVFRESLFKPLLKAIEERGLGAQIDYVAYSCDLPWRVNLFPDFPDENFRKSSKPIASMSSATYLYQHVMNQSPGVAGLNVNWYVPGPVAGRDRNLVSCTALGGVPSRGFRNRYAWSPDGGRAAKPDGGQRFLLSTMLGVLGDRGNTVEEIVRALTSAAAADATRPDGTFYYMQNDDIRSTARHACFESAARLLEAEGARAVVRPGVLPEGARDVLGITTGTQKFNLPSGIRIVPGALCEHLTSWGGVMSGSLPQTSLAEFIRHGAAGASGTVVEPLALQAKFPLPTLHLHYRRGCSLAEAFYQSVAAPYQLIVVGDPLCQPWADPPGVTVEGVTTGQRVAGPLTLTPRVSGAGFAPCEVFIDGRLTARVPADKPLTLEADRLPEGWHELRVVATRDDAIETQGRFVATVRVAHGDASQGSKGPTLHVAPTGRVPASAELTVTCHVPGAERVRLLHDSYELGRFDGERGTLRVPAGDLGEGPARLLAVGDPPGGGEPVRGAPVWVWVE